MKTLRESIIYILFCIILAIAAFEAGIIYEFKGIDSSQKRLTKLEINQQELVFKTMAHETILRKMGK